MTCCPLEADAGYRALVDPQAEGAGRELRDGREGCLLPSNRLGLVYRTCKSGAVNEVILCERDGRYGRLRRTLENGDLVEVIDVTELAAEEGYDLADDWTEVRLLGNEADQETARAPYNGDPVVDAQWRATSLYHRFYRVPAGLRVTLLAGTHKLGDGTRVFEPLPRRAAAGAFERTETVEAPGGVKIHYFYDPPYEKSPSRPTTSMTRSRAPVGAWGVSSVPTDRGRRRRSRTRTASCARPPDTAQGLSARSPTSMDDRRDRLFAVFQAVADGSAGPCFRAPGHPPVPC